MTDRQNDSRERERETATLREFFTICKIQIPAAKRIDRQNRYVLRDQEFMDFPDPAELPIGIVYFNLSEIPFTAGQQPGEEFRRVGKGRSGKPDFALPLQIPEQFRKLKTFRTRGLGGVQSLKHVEIERFRSALPKLTIHLLFGIRLGMNPLQIQFGCEKIGVARIFFQDFSKQRSARSAEIIRGGIEIVDPLFHRKFNNPFNLRSIVSV